MSELPTTTKKLPYHGKRIFMKAFNNAREYYDSEDTAFAVAWSAVKRKYRKNKSGRWVAREDANDFDTTQSDTTTSCSSSSSESSSDENDDYYYD